MSQSQEKSQDNAELDLNRCETRPPARRLLWPDARPQAVLVESFSDESDDEDEDNMPPSPPASPSDDAGPTEEDESPAESSIEDESEPEPDQGEVEENRIFMEQVAEDDFLVQARIFIARHLSAVEIDGIILNEPDWYRWCILSNYIQSLDGEIQRALRTSGGRVFRN